MDNHCYLFVLSLWMLQKGLFSLLQGFFLFCSWYYYAGASNSWAVYKFISPQKSHLAHLLIAESTSWHAFKRKSLFYQQQLCLSFNLDQQIGSHGTVQEAIPGRLQSKISFERTVMKGNYIISLSFCLIFPPCVFLFFFFKRKQEWKQSSFEGKVESINSV